MNMQDVAMQLSTLLKQIENELGSYTDAFPDEEEQDVSTTFNPPLQSELELLKKNAGVESEFDGEQVGDARQTDPHLMRDFI